MCRMQSQLPDSFALQPTVNLTLPKVIYDQLVQERDDLRRLVRLLDEQRAASGWGAAVGQREEEIAGLRRNLGLD